MSYIDDLIESKREIQEKIKEVQDTCSHTHHTYKPMSNTGNWCPQDDYYWVKLKCLSCYKSWTEDQKVYYQSELHKYGVEV